MTVQMFSVFSILFYLIALLMFFRVHALDPSVSIIRDPVSNYGVGKTAVFFRRYGYWGTVAAACLAVSFLMSHSPVFPNEVLIGMVLLPILRIGVIGFKTDIQVESLAHSSAEGQWRVVFAIVWVGAMYTVITNATPLMVSDSDWLLAGLSILKNTAKFSLIGVIFAMIKPLKMIFGIFERVFLLSTLLWFVLANIWFLLK